MPETRHIEEINYPPDTPDDERTIANAEVNGWITQMPYVVSDEELEQEQAQEDIAEFLKKPDDKVKTSDIAKYLKAQAKLGK